MKAGDILYWGWYFGHKIYVSWKDSHLPGYKYKYMDTDEYVLESPKRTCPVCKEYETAESHDPCIANLPGVRNACCGHGCKNRYIQLDNEERTLLHGEEMEEYLRKMGR